VRCKNSFLKKKIKVVKHGRATLYEVREKTPICRVDLCGSN
jgi:hypothetical protein